MDDLIKSITEAEEKAAAIKNDAVIKAGQIIEAARTRAAEMDEQSAERCAKFISDSMGEAQAKADKEYALFIEKSKSDAKAYAESLKSNVGTAAFRVVGRITDGNS